MLLRPERLMIGGTGPDRLSGRVTDAVFLGQMVRYHVTLANGREMVAVANDSAIRHAHGDEVTISWDPGDAWLIPRDG